MNAIQIWELDKANEYHPAGTQLFVLDDMVIGHQRPDGDVVTYREGAIVDFDLCDREFKWCVRTN